MGCFVPHHITSKGPILYFLDMMSRRPDGREMLESLSEALIASRREEFADIVSICQNYLFRPLEMPDDLCEAIAKYLNQYWFDLESNDVYFPSLQPVAPILGEGIIKSIELSVKEGNRGKSRKRAKPGAMPIDSWWLVDHPDVKVVNLVSPQQITHLFMTPRPPGRYRLGVWKASAKVYTTSRSAIKTVKFNNVAR